MLRVLSRKSLILSVTVLLGLLFLLFSTVVFGTAENVYADDEELMIDEEEIMDDGGCCPSGPGELITLDDIPNTGAVSDKGDGLSLDSVPSVIPLVVIVMGFGNIAYDNNYDWANMIFSDSRGIREYYNDMSYGQFSFEAVVESSKYGSGGNTNTKDRSNDGIIHVNITGGDHFDWSDWENYASTYQMARSFIEAINKASAYIDFPSYDANNDGKISKSELAILFLVGGYDSSGEIYSSDVNKKMRSHCWSIYGILDEHNIPSTSLSVPKITKNGKTVEVNYYASASEKIRRKRDDNTVYDEHERIGSMCHELGHHLGLPDLYDTQDTAGNWGNFAVHRMSLMAGGSWTKDLSGNYRPPSFDPWCKIQLGWLTYSYLDKMGTYSINAGNYVTNTKPKILKIYMPGSYKDYYLVENRRAEDWDEGLQAAYTLDTSDKKGGLVLWHIDQQVLDSCYSSTATDNSDYGRKIYRKINDSDHRPSVMPLYLERNSSGNLTFIGDGAKDHVYEGVPMYDLKSWKKYQKSVGYDINLPTYQNKPITYGPASTRAYSDVHVELLSDSGSTMRFRYIPGGHTHSWTTTQEVTGEYCSTGRWAEIKTCSSCGQVRRTEKQGTAQHKYPLKYYPRIEPGCTSWGRDAHYECERCHEKYVDELGYYGTYTDEELKIPPQGHDYQIDDPYEPATYDSSGYAWMVCSRCGDGMWETFPMLDRTEKKAKDGTICGPDGAIEAADPYLQSYGSEKDPAGSQFHKIVLRSPKQTKTSIQLKWTGPSNVVEYWLYGSKCGSGKKYKKCRITPQKGVTVFDIDEVDLKKSTYYKFIVVGVDYDNNIVSTSKAIHVATKGSKKKSNNTSVYVSKKIVSKAGRLKKGKSLALKAKARKGKGCTVAKHIGLRYESTNKKIAKVSSKGTIKGVKKGTCYVYAYAQNGVYKKIRVKVR